MNVLREKTSEELFASDGLNLDKPLRAVSSPRVKDLFAPESSGTSNHGLADYDTPSSRARGGRKWQLTWNLREVRTRRCKAEIWILICAKRICLSALRARPTKLTLGGRSNLRREGRAPEEPRHRRERSS